MNTRDLEELELGIYLAKSKQEQAAHFIFSRLRENNPHNIQVLAFCAFTATDPQVVEESIETAIKLDPSNHVLQEARDWLKENGLIIVRPPILSSSDTQTVSSKETLSIPVSAASVIEPGLANPIPKINKPPLKQSSQIIRLVKLRSTHKGSQFTRVWWLLLICLLVLVGTALALIVLSTPASNSNNNLNETEKAYLQKISQLDQKTKDVTARLETAKQQFNQRKLPKEELIKNLSQAIGLDEQFRLLPKNLSPRFVKLNQLLGEAYNNFVQGAVNLKNGLEANSAELVTKGNEQFDLGYEYLRQARVELKNLGS